MATFKQSLKAAKKVFITLTPANHPVSISLQVAKFTINDLIGQGFDGNNPDIANWELDADGDLWVFFQT
jgi:hypothetical protein